MLTVKLQRWGVYLHTSPMGRSHLQEVPDTGGKWLKYRVANVEIKRLEAENKKLRQQVCILEAMTGFGGGTEHQVARDRGWADCFES